MTVEAARVAELRGAAGALRASAARSGLAAWHTGQACGGVPSWQGVHAGEWSRRGVEVAAASRQLEGQLRRLATAAELYAAAVEAAQARLRALDVEAGALTAATGRALQEWAGAPGEERGPRPDAAAGLASLDGRRRHVEESAEQDARAYAARVQEVCASTGRPPSAASVLQAVLDSPWFAYGYGLPSAVAGVAGPVLIGLGRALPAMVAAGRSLPALPRGLVVPLRVAGVVGAPLAFVSDVRTLSTEEVPGIRDDADRIVAGVAVVGTTIGVVGTVAAVAGVAGVAAAVLPGVVAVGLLAGGYALGTWAWDHRPRRAARARRPVRPLRTPPARLPPTSPSSPGSPPTW